MTPTPPGPERPLRAGEGPERPIRAGEGPERQSRAGERAPTVGRFAAGLVGLFVVTTVGGMGLWAATTTFLYGSAPVVVSSGSMAPALDVGDLVVVEPYHGQGIHTGTVVVFDDQAAGRSTIHRVVKVKDDGTFTTRGDANPTADSTPLELSEVDASGRFLLPRMGLPIVWAQQGRWLLVVLALAGLALAVWLARFALLDVHDPWLAGTVPEPGTGPTLRERLVDALERARVTIGEVGVPRGVAQVARRRAAEVAAVLLAVVLAHATVTAYAAFADTTANGPNQFVADTLGPPSGLSVASSGCGGASAIVEVDSATTVNSASGASVVVSRPAGAQVGDLLVAQVAFHTHSFVGTITAPAGWTTVRVDDDSNHEMQGVFWKFVSGSEPATYTFTNTTADTGREGSGGIVAYDGVDTVSPIDAHGATVYPTGGTSITAPSLNTTVPGTRLLTLVGQRANGPVTPPTGMTERFEVTSSNQNLVELSDQAIAAAGTTGTRTATSADNGSSVAQSVALRPLQVTSVGSAGVGSASNGNTSTISLPVPAAAAAGDVLVAHVVLHTHVFGANPLPAPSGWTRVRTDSDNNHVIAAVFWRVATGSEPASYSFTNNSGDTTQQATGAIMAYRGVDPAHPIDAHAGATSVTGSDTLVAPSVTTTRPNTRLLSLVGVYGNDQGPATPPASMTERYEDTVTSEVSVIETLGEAADERLSAAGASGTRSTTVPGTDTSVAQSIVLRPDTGEPNADLTWTPSASAAVDGYIVERWIGGVLDNSTTVTPGTASSYTDGPLVSGTTYTYRVIATAGTWRSTPLTTTYTPTNC